MTPAEEMGRVVRAPRLPDDDDRYRGAGCAMFLVCCVVMALPAGLALLIIGSAPSSERAGRLVAAALMLVWPLGSVVWPSQRYGPTDRTIAGGPEGPGGRYTGRSGAGGRVGRRGGAWRPDPASLISAVGSTRGPADGASLTSRTAAAPAVAVVAPCPPTPPCGVGGGGRNPLVGAR